MTEMERVLQVLIHDARTPIGVAQGYLRLLQEGRLPTGEERARALARAMDAIGRLARLCDEASGFIGDGGQAEAAAVWIPAAELAARVARHAGERQFAVDCHAIDPQARVSLAGGVDRVADAILEVLATIRTPEADAAPILQVVTCASELRFTGTPHGQPAAAAGDSRPFDPWRALGLAVPLACKAIARSTGRVAIAGSAVTVAFPLETNAA